MTQPVTGGTFTTSKSAPGPGVGTGLVLEVVSGSATAHTLTVNTTTGTNGFVLPLPGNAILPFGEDTASVVIDAADANVSWRWRRTDAAGASFLSANAVVTNPAGDQTITLASGKSFIVKDNAGNTIFQALDTGDAVTITGAPTIALNPTGTQFKITDPGDANLLAVVRTAGNDIWGFSNSQYQITNGKLSRYNGIVSAGNGVPSIYASGALTLNTNVPPTTLTYTPPAAAGVYRLSGYLDILTATTLTFKVLISYTDPGGNARTDIPVFTQQNSATLLVGGPAANSTGRFSFSYVFAVNNSATAITLADNGGTYTSGTYYWTPNLEQLA